MGSTAGGSAARTVTRVLLWPIAVVAFAALLPIVSAWPGSPLIVEPLDRFSLIFVAFVGLVAGSAIEGLIIAHGIIRALERLAVSGDVDEVDGVGGFASLPYRGVSGCMSEMREQQHGGR